ncbi:MAG TPA: hypothetical protein ENK29_04345, partial [Chromatiales bacterium]|nr:hypothetical protein [Chromatiales bacterium]
GDLATLTHIEETADGILFHAETDSGKRVAWNPEDYEHFQHGYAVTAHKSQGVTVDHAHVLIHEGMSDREWSYVAASRSREATHLYCTADVYAEAARTMSRSRQADTTQDYEREVLEMAQIPELNEDISEAELEAQTAEETARLAEPDGFDALLDEIREDEKADEERRRRLMEMQKQKEEDEEEKEKEEEKQREAERKAEAESDPFESFQEQQARQNEAAAEVENVGFDDAAPESDEQAARESDSGTEMEV